MAEKHIESALKHLAAVLAAFMTGLFMIVAIPVALALLMVWVGLFAALAIPVASVAGLMDG